MPFSKRPEQIRIKATRSRWALVHIGLNLKDKGGKVVAKWIDFSTVGFARQR